MARVGIDLDGVCYDFGASLAEFLVGHRGWDPAKCSAPRRWEFYEDWGLTLPEFMNTCHDGVDAGVVFAYGEPFPGTRDALDRIRESGHTLHVATDRRFGTADHAVLLTLRWLAEHELPYDTITFAADKTLLRVDYMIEDKLENYDALVETGCWAYLLDRPWNQAVQGWPGSTARMRVDSLGEFADVVCQ